jgi:hypothetical protein
MSPAEESYYGFGQKASLSIAAKMITPVTNTTKKDAAADSLSHPHISSPIIKTSRTNPRPIGQILLDVTKKGILNSSK